MNRRITGVEILGRVKRLKERIPNITLRTSIIVGFPGESEEDFQTLLNGVKEAKFDHLGIFRYSDEEGTPAFKLEPKVSQDTIEKRFDLLHEAQREVVREKNDALIGQAVNVIVEGEHPETELLIKGRSEGQAPDIDGNVYINDSNGKILEVGDMVKVRITEKLEYDLIGEVVD